MAKLHLNRLRRLAAHLETVDERNRKQTEKEAATKPAHSRAVFVYDQSKLQHDCGTPACALGEWAALHQKRGLWRGGFAPRLSVECGPISSAAKEFNITFEEAVELFSAEGMGQAKTATAAAKFLRGFIRKNAHKITHQKKRRGLTWSLWTPRGVSHDSRPS